MLQLVSLKSTSNQSGYQNLIKIIGDIENVHVLMGILWYKYDFLWFQKSDYIKM